jgi:hypothetical protein
MDGGATFSQMDLLERCRREADTFVEVACVLRNRLLRSELPDVVLPNQPQRSRLVRDPYDGKTTLVCAWLKSGGKVIGSLAIHENGQLFAELDVLQPLPKDAAWFVDAAVAFGTSGSLSSELRLTPAIT